MRIFFLFFLLAWLIGLGLGVSGVWILGWGVMAGLALIMWLMRFGWPVITAAALLIGLGVVWGDAAVPQDVGQNCEAEIDVNSRWTVIDTPDQREDSLRVLVESGGCKWLASFSPFADINRGDELEISGGERQTLVEVSEWSPGYADYLGRQGISGTWSYPTFAPPMAEAMVGRPSVLMAQVNKLRGGLVSRVDRIFIEPDASVVKALLLAERGTIPEEMTANFRASGVSHVLAISGLHISLMAGLMLLVLLALPIGPWPRTLILLISLWLYVGFIGLPASAERAALFWTFALLALRLHWLVSLPTIFWLAVAVMATINPLAMLEVGWQLSVSAVAGIFMALFLNRAHAPRSSADRRSVVGSYLFNLIIVSLGATLATGPLVAYHFGTISLANVVANVLVVPVVPALLITAMLALALSFIFNPLALATAYIFNLLLTWMNWVTNIVAGIPGLYLEEVSVSKWQIVIYYLLLVGLAVWWLHKQGRSWREVWG